MMAEYVEAPTYWSRLPNQPGVFLAGGITGCPDWQRDAARMLATSNYAILNPRRVNFPIGNPTAAHQQIKWEHDHLRMADVILFWFCAETIQPIVLYELGTWSMTNKPLFVGVSPDYVRIQDVQIQTSLVRPDVKIVSSLAETVDMVIRFEKELISQWYGDK